MGVYPLSPWPNRFSHRHCELSDVYSLSMSGVGGVVADGACGEGQAWQAATISHSCRLFIAL